jgi:hypothetical protein
MKAEILARRPFASSVSRFILLGVLLPNIVYLGHWGVGDTAAHEASHEHSASASDTSDAHTLHCHAGLSKCAGAQAMIGALWVGEDAGLLTFDASPLPHFESAAVIPPESPVTRILQPPRAV